MTTFPTKPLLDRKNGTDNFLTHLKSCCLQNDNSRTNRRFSSTVFTTKGALYVTTEDWRALVWEREMKSRVGNMEMQGEFLKNSSSVTSKVAYRATPGGDLHRGVQVCRSSEM